MKLSNNLDRIRRLEKSASKKGACAYYAELDNGKYTVTGHNFPKRVFTEKEFGKFCDRIAEIEPMSVILIDDIQFSEEN